MSLTVNRLTATGPMGPVETPPPARHRSPRAALPADRLTVRHTSGQVPPGRQVSLSQGVDPSTLKAGEQGIGATAPTPVGHPLTDAVPGQVKIGLVVAQSQAVVGVLAPTTVGDVRLEPGQSYRLSLSAPGRLQIASESGANLGTVTLPARIAPTEGAGVSVAGRRYRGDLDVIAAPGEAGKLTLVNDVAIEDYLKGVLPAEMATGWPAQALQAQAVAARTYAVGNLGRREALGFDLYPTVADQVYKGRDAEADDTSAAVAATRGEVMTYDGKPINALFFSSSGGCTDDAKATWDLDLPYIKPVTDPDGSPNASWTVTHDKAQVKQTLAKLGENVGTPRSITITTRTPGGRARWLRIAGDQGTVTVDAQKYRLASGLKSTKFAVSATRSGFVFTGSGYGHGLGMSQWGAHNRAVAGQTYQEILKTYYTGIVITRDGEPAP
jgi:stage II sporulation protein D